MKLGDTGEYHSIVDALRRLKKEVRSASLPKKDPGDVAQLYMILTGLYDRMETHAIQHKPGVAGILFSNLSGQADLPILKRVDKACRDFGSVSDSSPAAGARRGRRGGGMGAGFGGGESSSSGDFRNRNRSAPSRRGGGPRRRPDASNIKCHHCFEMGHYRYDCPLLAEERKPPL